MSNKNISPTSYLNFDKHAMTNLQNSLTKEILLSNRQGGFCSTSVVGCNIRKYNGLFIVPIPSLDSENHVLLSSLDESIIMHGAAFNLAIHKFQGDNYSPKGHKYITKFEWDKVPSITYRVGDAILQKELLMMSNENRLLIRYTVIDSSAPITLQFKPMLAFRSVREFTHINHMFDANVKAVENGVSLCMYQGYPNLVMQFSKLSVFKQEPNWYFGFDYPRERERGYSSNEDLYCPGYFELSIKKGESIVFSAGLKEAKPLVLKRHFTQEMNQQDSMCDFYNCLMRSAHQFHQEKAGEHYIHAGFPWFKFRARDTFIAMPGLTLSIGEKNTFEQYMQTAAKALQNWMNQKPLNVEIYEIEQPDVLLWATWCIQQYANVESMEECFERYGYFLHEIFDFILEGKHPNLFVHDNGLLYAYGRDKAITWMNSVSRGKPVIPRSGYIVEFNALWYNGLCFWAELLKRNKKLEEADRISRMASLVKDSFRSTFLNQYGYLFDYVDGEVACWDVRPNMLFAIALDHSPLERTQQKQVLDICTKELLTFKGIRSLTPKAGQYNPYYEGTQDRRDLAYHQGTAWPWLTGFYLEAYHKIKRISGLSFIENQLVGIEEEMFYHSLGSMPEMFDGNPPFHGRGDISFAINVAGILRTIRLLDKQKEKLSY